MKSLIKKYEELPQYLKDKAKFCVWKQESGKGKVPYQVNGKKARANKINTFTDFKKALDVVDRFDGLGIGIFNKISAIDIDNCIDASGNYSDLAKDVMDIFKDSYIEKSPSGKGIRIIFLIDEFSYDKSLYYINNQKLGLEVYVAGSTNKYVTITGDVINQGDILLANDQLKMLLDRYMQRRKVNIVISEENSSSYLSDKSVIEKLKDNIMADLSEQREVTTEEAEQMITSIFEDVANELDIGKSTVQDKCTRGLGISSSEFYNLAVRYLIGQDEELENTVVEHRKYTKDEESDVRTALRNVRDNY